MADDHKCDSEGSRIPQRDGTIKVFCSKCSAHTATE
jgi:hypothetical protein